jgi:acyl-CoA dehydrogenase
MPDLILDADRQQYQDLARDFALKEIAPDAQKFDHSPAFPLDIYKKAWEIGLLNPRLPENLGGLGLAVQDACVMAEEFGAACPAIGTALWGNDLAVAPLMVAGNEEQHQTWLTPLANEFGLAGYCFPADSSVSYKSAGNGFELNGQAIAVNAKYCQWLLVTATGTGSNTKTMFVVPATSTSGLTVGDLIETPGLKCADLRTVKFENVRIIAAASMIGSEGSAGSISERSRTCTDPIRASYSVGIMRSALDHCVRYAKERHTMGVPIANHQAVAFMLADIAKDFQAARFMVRKAAWLTDNDKADQQASTMARIFAAETAMQSTIDAVQVFGGYGYSREYPVEKLMRDAKTMQVFDCQPLNDQIAVGQLMLACAAKSNQV